MSTLAVGLTDLKRSWQFLPLSLQLAVTDVRGRYARSMLGPFWVTLSMLGMSAAIGFLMSGLFGAPLRQILPFVMLGIILWSFIAQASVEACSALIASRAHLLGSPLPYSSFAYTVVIRNFIFLLHHASAYVVLAAALRIFPSPGWLLAIPGLVLLLASAMGLVLLLSALAPRYRDLGPLTAMLTAVGALLTPVYWRPELLVKNKFIASANPFTHLLAVVRQPLLNEPVGAQSWIVASVFAVVALGVGAGVFVMVRKRLPFWV